MVENFKHILQIHDIAESQKQKINTCIHLELSLAAFCVCNSAFLATRVESVLARECRHMPNNHL